jgi:hypothetical protein
MAGRPRHRPERPPTHRSRTTADRFRPLATPPQSKCCRLQRRPQPSGCPSPPGCIKRSPARKSAARAPATRDPPDPAARRRSVTAQRCQVEASESTGYRPEVGDSGPPPADESGSNRSMSGASAGHVARVLAPLRAAPPPNLALCWLNRQHGSLPRRQSASAASRPLAARLTTHATRGWACPSHRSALSGRPLASAGSPAVVAESTRQGLAKPPGGLWP